MAAYPDQSKKSYLTMSNYYQDIFAYNTQTSRLGKVTGSLSLLDSSLSNACSKGHFLVENGKKLYPGGSYPGISTLMVGVHDPATGVKGFIDPNSYAFTDFSSDRPAASIDPNPLRVGVNPNGSLISDDKAAPVYTHGDILADGSAVVGGSITTTSTIVGGFISSFSTIAAGSSVTAGTLVTAGTGVVASTGQVRVNRVVALAAAASYVIDPTLAQVFQITTENNTNTPTITSTNESLATGAVVYIMVINGSASSRNIDFNANFRTVNAGQRTIAGSTTNMFTFVCNGANLFQVGEALALSQ